MQSANTKLLKEINTLTVLDIIREKEPISRADIVKESNLAFPTVMRIVDALIGLNLVVETEKVSTGVGRKPILLMLNKDAFYVMGILIFSRVDIVLLDIKTNIVAKQYASMDLRNIDFEKEIELIVDAVENILAKTKIDRASIAGIGIGMPGTDFKSNELIEHFQFQGWQRDLDVKSLLEKRLKIKVYVDNISRTMTYGEIFYGWGKKYKDFVYLMVDFGVSGNIVQNSKILTGKNDVAGEYGHVSINHLSGRECYCGNKGCIESYTSEYGILKTIQQELPLYEKSILHEWIGNDINNLNFEMAVKALREGDALVKKIFDEAGKMIGLFLVNMINMINPPVIILGGSVIAADPDIVKIAEDIIKKGVFSNKARKTKIVCSSIPKEKLYLGTTARIILNALNDFAIEKK
jgi:Transcriptional regulator/sugar kinase